MFSAFHFAPIILLDRFCYLVQNIKLWTTLSIIVKRMQILSIFAQLPLLSSMYSQVLVKTCPYARSPPNFPHSEMTAQGDRQSVVYGKSVDLGGRRIIHHHKRVICMVCRSR